MPTFGSDKPDPLATDVLGNKGLNEHFEPVQEIRRLRFELAHRIEALRRRDVFSRNDDSFSVHQPMPASPSLEWEIDGTIREKTSGFCFRKEDGLPESGCLSQQPTDPIRLQQRLETANQMLALLRHPAPKSTNPCSCPPDQGERQSVFIDDTPSFMKPTSAVSSIMEKPALCKRPEEMPKRVGGPEGEMSDFFDKGSDTWLMLLKKMNTFLGFVGLLAVLLGLLFYLRGSGNDPRIGFPIAVTGLSLILIGVTGRWLQDYINRLERRRGKLTIFT